MGAPFAAAVGHRMTRHRVLIVDDHAIFREGLRALLERPGAGTTVVGEADSGQQAIASAEQLAPDLVIVDVGIRGLSGIDATRQIRARCPAARVIALSMQSDPTVVRRMLDAGALAYVIKDAAFEELSQAIGAVLAGRTFVSPALRDGLVDRIATRSLSPLDVLTPKEREVLQLIAEGKTTKEAAAALAISPKTVDTHRQHIMEKLNLQTVADLTRLAVREGLVSAEK